MSKNKAGLTVGAFVGLLHLLWSILVATESAEFVLDWAFKLHFLNNAHPVAVFSWKIGLALVVITTIGGYIFGWVLALLWNAMHKKY